MSSHVIARDVPLGHHVGHYHQAQGQWININFWDVREPKSDMSCGELRRLEKLAQEARCDADLTLGAILLHIKKEKHFLAAGHSSFGDYIDERSAVYGVRRRQAERLICGSKVLSLLRNQAVAPTSERQVSTAVIWPGLATGAAFAM